MRRVLSGSLSQLRWLHGSTSAAKPVALSPFAAAQLALFTLHCTAGPSALPAHSEPRREARGGFAAWSREEDDESPQARARRAALLPAQDVATGELAQDERHTDGLLKRRIKRALLKAGVKPSDIPIFLLTLSGLKWATLLASVGLCAVFKPLTRFAATRTGSKVTAQLAVSFPRGTKWVRDNVLKAKAKTPAWYSRYMPPQLLRGLGEGMVLYKITAPVWLPLEIWGLTVWFKRGGRAPSIDGSSQWG